MLIKLLFPFLFLASLTTALEASDVLFKTANQVVKPQNAPTLRTQNPNLPHNVISSSNNGNRIEVKKSGRYQLSFNFNLQNSNFRNIICSIVLEKPPGTLSKRLFFNNAMHPNQVISVSNEFVMNLKKGDVLKLTNYSHVKQAGTNKGVPIQFIKIGSSNPIELTFQRLGNIK